MKIYERQIGLMPEVLRLICMSEAEMSGGRLGEAVSSPDWLIISIDGHFSPPLPAIRPLRRISGLSILKGWRYEMNIVGHFWQRNTMLAHKKK